MTDVRGPWNNLKFEIESTKCEIMTEERKFEKVVSSENKRLNHQFKLNTPAESYGSIEHDGVRLTCPMQWRQNN